MATNPDFKDLFAAFSDAGADFLVVGAHAVMFFTEPRTTKDIDVWVRPTRANAERVYRALGAFGAPLDQLSVDDLCVHETIFQIGVAPNRVDVLTSIDAVEFDEAWASRIATTYGDVPIAVLSLDLLLRNKRYVDRQQDRLDVERLERVKR